MKPFRSSLSVVLALALSMLSVRSLAAQAPPPQGAPAPSNPDPWPKSAVHGGATFTMFQPQLDSWDQSNLSAHAAVSVLTQKRSHDRPQERQLAHELVVRESTAPLPG